MRVDEFDDKLLMQPYEHGRSYREIGEAREGVPYSRSFLRCYSPAFSR